MDREALPARDGRPPARPRRCGAKGLTSREARDPGPRRDSSRAGAPPLPDPSVPWIDAHAHLADVAFDADRDAALERAREAGARGVVCIGESLEAAARARAFADRHPGLVWWTAGVHPHDAASYDPAHDEPAIRACLADGAVAVGECGLDYHYDHSPRPLQRRAFADQLAIAGDTGHAVVVHTREAEDDTAAMVREAGGAGIRGVLHCFTGSHELARVGLDAGWYISFSGIVTFRAWTDEALLRLVPADRLLIESDSPYLAPVPFRGKRNEPAWCAYTVQRLAAARGAEPHALGAQLVANTRALFGLT